MNSEWHLSKLIRHSIRFPTLNSLRRAAPLQKDRSFKPDSTCHRYSFLYRSHPLITEMPNMERFTPSSIHFFQRHLYSIMISPTSPFTGLCPEFQSKISSSLVNWLAPCSKTPNAKKKTTDQVKRTIDFQLSSMQLNTCQ